MNGRAGGGEARAARSSAPPAMHAAESLHRAAESLRILVAASRPFGWVTYATFALAGLIVSGGRPSAAFLIQLLLLTFPACLVVFGLNDVYDLESDAINPRKGFAEGIRLRAAHHALVVRASAACAALLALASVLTANVTNVVGAALLLTLAWAYSAPPARLKERPLVDSLTNGAMLLGAFLIGFSYGLSIDRMHATWYAMALAGAGMHAFTTIMDYTPDRRAGYRTFAIVFGKRAAAGFALVSTLVFAASLERTAPPQLFLVWSSGIYLIALANPSEPLARMLFRVGYVQFVVMAIALAIVAFS